MEVRLGVQQRRKSNKNFSMLCLPRTILRSRGAGLQLLTISNVPPTTSLVFNAVRVILEPNGWIDRITHTAPYEKNVQLNCTKCTVTGVSLSPRLFGNYTK